MSVLLTIYQVKNKYTITQRVFTPRFTTFYTRCLPHVWNVQTFWGRTIKWEFCFRVLYQNNLHKSEGENFVKNFSIQRSGLRLIVCKWDFRNPRISKYKKENGTGKDILNLEKQQNFTQVSKIAILKKWTRLKIYVWPLML